MIPAGETNPAGNEPAASIPRKTLWLLLALQGAILALAALLAHNSGWDDGAITLAYARTFAHTGRIALTPASEQVEGFSSIAWFLINVIPQLLGAGFRAAIVSAQFLTIASLLATTPMIAGIARNIGLTRPAALSATVTFVLFGPCIAEAVNGMEMGLLAAAGAFITLSYTRPDRNYNRFALAAAIAIFITTRFEASFYMVFLALPLLTEKRIREFMFAGILATLVFGAAGVARWDMFAELLPNTIYAKMHPPYSPRDLANAVVSRVEALFEFPSLFTIPAALMAYLGLGRLVDACRQLDRRHGYLLYPILGALLFSIVTGKNWGYTGRMQFVAIPHALLLMGALFDRFKTSTAKAWPRQKLIRFSTAGTILLSIALSVPFGAFKRSFHHDSFGVTPQSYRTTGMIVDAVRKKLGEPVITFMTPDVGGLGLCCSRIRVVDLAMLTNRTLARHGYAALPAVLARENPALIEAHQIWASYSRLYQLPRFENDYYPAFIDRTRFYIRRDIMKRLLARHIGCLASLARKKMFWDVTLGHRYMGNSAHADDVEFIKRGEVYALTTGNDGC